VNADVDISVLGEPVADADLDQLASVLVDCVEGGASVSFMSPFSQAQALTFFRNVASSVASGDTVLLAAKLGDKWLMHADLARLPAQHRLLAGDAPVIAGQRAAFAERAMAGHHERDRVLPDRGADRA
jgi:hypothetical protein